MLADRVRMLGLLAIVGAGGIALACVALTSTSAIEDAPTLEPPATNESIDLVIRERANDASIHLESELDARLAENDGFMCNLRPRAEMENARATLARLRVEAEVLRVAVEAARKRVRTERR